MKVCNCCQRKFENVQDLVKYGSRWQVCNRGYFWFNCECKSTLIVKENWQNLVQMEDFLDEPFKTIAFNLNVSNKLPKRSSDFMSFRMEIDSDDFDPPKIAKRIKNHPIFAANVLKTANSLKTVDSGKIDNVLHAITYFGKEKLLQILDLLAIQGASSPCKIFNLENFWQEEIAKANMGIKFSHKFLPNVELDRVYLATSLMNLGKVVQAYTNPVATDRVARDFSDRRNKYTWAQLEAEHGLYDHSALGFIGCSLWGIDKDYGEVAFYHRRPFQSPKHLRKLSVASFLASEIYHWKNFKPFLLDEKTMDKCLDFIGVSRKIFEKYIDDLVEEEEEAS